MKATVEKPKKTNERQNGVLTYRQIRNRVGDGWGSGKIDPNVVYLL